VNCQSICPICVFGNCDSGSYGSGQCICTSNQFFGTLCENQNLCYGRESFCANGSLTSNTAITITNNSRFQVQTLIIEISPLIIDDFSFLEVTNNLIVKSQLNITNSVLVVGGNFSLTKSSVMTLSGNSTVTVGGCVEFSGSLILNTIPSSGQIISYSCHSGSFDKVTIKDCSSQESQQYSETRFSLLFSSSSGCQTTVHSSAQLIVGMWVLMLIILS